MECDLLEFANICLGPKTSRIPSLTTFDDQNPNMNGYTGQVTAPGYDNMTGLGTPDEPNFIKDLRSAGLSHFSAQASLILEGDQKRSSLRAMNPPSGRAQTSVWDHPCGETTTSLTIRDGVAGRYRKGSTPP